MSLLPTPTNRLRRTALRHAERTLGLPTIHEIERIPGCLSREQGAMLSWLVSQSPANGCIVEIGSFMGRSTRWLGHSIQRTAPRRLISIDPHEGHERPNIETGTDSYEAFLANIRNAGLADTVTVLRERSQTVATRWTDPIALLWIDGSHDYADVLADLEGFTGHVLHAGHVALHDTRGRKFPGVRRAMLEFFAAHPDFEPLAHLRNMAVYRRTDRLIVR